MNRVEHNEVLKTLGINNITDTFKGRFGTTENVYSKLNLLIYFNGNYQSVVRGEIPKDIEEIKEKYNLSTEDMYKYNEGENETTYHFHNKEGLLRFLIEIIKRKSDVEIDYDDALAEVYTRILKAINPTITPKEWVNAEDKNTELSKVLKEFDSTVNPFQDREIKQEEMKEYIKNVSVTALPSEREGKKGCWLLTTDRKTGDNVTYFRGAESIAYLLSYKTQNGDVINNITHTYRYNDETASVDELVTIEAFSNNDKIPGYYYTLDINNLVINNKPVNLHLLQLIHTKLLEGIEVASKVTLENLKANEKNV